MTPITLQGLRKAFGRTVAVDGVDLEIPAGSLFFLLGPSGCGKTTLLRMIAGFTEPSAGDIRFGTDNVTHLPANKRQCGMVFQGYALWPHMTVSENVAFGLRVRKLASAQRSQRVDAALHTVRMREYAHRKPNELSGGQQQRVALARALVIEPRVLLLDEPLSNLDAKLRLQMRGEIKRICGATNITAVYVTHDQKEALSMADQVAVMHEGKVVQVGPPQLLYRRPASRFVADFLGETNFIEAQIVGREAGEVVLQCPAGRLRSSVFPDGLPETGNVVCSIRPEAIRLVVTEQTPQWGAGIPADAAGMSNRFDARVIDQVYLGETAQHRVAVGGEVELKVFELNPRPPRNGDADARQQVQFDPADVVILRD